MWRAACVRFVGGDTPAERIWAVDADLRPEGRSGPLARSLEGWDGYLERWASTWERQAYLRVRHVAGDAELGRRLVDRIQSAVWERPLSPAEEREVRRMKVRIEQERIAPGEDPEFHLKLGRGSLADIEFTVQLLQLRHRVPDAVDDVGPATRWWRAGTSRPTRPRCWRRPTASARGRGTARTSSWARAIPCRPVPS